MAAGRWRKELDRDNQRRRIRYREIEKQAIRRARVRMFVLVARGNLRIETLAEILLKPLPQIEAIVR